MAEPIGLSVASASIAALQLVARLHSISSAFFKSASVSQDLKVLQTTYEIELDRLQTVLQMLRPRDPNSTSIPMYVFAELYLQLRNQAAALELFQNEKWGTAPPLMARWRPIRWTLNDKRRIEGFIDALRRYCHILQEIVQLNALTSINTQLLSLQSERSVSAPPFLLPCINMPLVWPHPLSPRLASRSLEHQKM